MIHYIISEDEIQALSLYQELKGALILEEGIHELKTVLLDDIFHTKNESFPIVLIMDDYEGDIRKIFDALFPYYQCYVYQAKSKEKALKILEMTKPWFYTMDISISSGTEDLVDSEGYKVIKSQKENPTICEISSITISRKSVIKAIEEEEYNHFYIWKNDQNFTSELLKYSHKASLLYLMKKEKYDEETAIKELERIYKNIRSSSIEQKNSALSSIVGNSSEVKKLQKKIKTFANSNIPILILGKTGTGKELVAEAIHQLSGRSGVLKKLNVAGLDDYLFSDTLFGHKKGAFTGAATDRKGMIEFAEGGTLFLDEIGEISKESQIKLLRLLENGEFYPLGSDLVKKSGARILFATRRSPDELQSDENFREDFWYRINRNRIDVPSLDERNDDIPLLIDHFVDKFSSDEREQLLQDEAVVVHIDDSISKLLKMISWPGNVRELKNVIEQTYYSSENHRNVRMLRVSNLPKDIKEKLNLIQDETEHLLKIISIKLYKILSSVFGNEVWSNLTKENIIDNSQRSYKEFLDRITKDNIISNYHHFISSANSIVKLILNLKLEKEDFIDGFQVFLEKDPSLFNNHEITVIQIWDKFLEMKLKTPSDPEFIIDLRKVLCKKSEYDHQLKTGLLWLAVISLNIKSHKDFEFLRNFFTTPFRVKKTKKKKNPNSQPPRTYYDSVKSRYYFSSNWKEYTK